MGKFKVITHVFAVVGVAIMGFIATPAGQAIVAQYPVLTGIAGAISVLGAVYHKPTK